ncbi:prevent-host-death protein [Pseudomonas syringae pv. actinidiae]|nr:prevent-host-death protein [Pseudomonas syringae pv. actinidiae]
MKSISEIRACTSQAFFREVEAGNLKGPMLVTYDGIPAFVAIPIEEWTKMRESIMLMQILHQSSQEAAQGKTCSTEELKTRLSERFAEQKP